MRASGHILVGFVFVDFQEGAGGVFILGLDDFLDGIHHGKPNRAADIFIGALRPAGFVQGDMKAF